MKDCSKEVGSNLWSKATTFGVVGEGYDKVFGQAIKELVVRDGIFSLSQKVESITVFL